MGRTDPAVAGKKSPSTGRGTLAGVDGFVAGAEVPTRRLEKVRPRETLPVRGQLLSAAAACSAAHFPTAGQRLPSRRDVVVLGRFLGTLMVRSLETLQQLSVEVEHAYQHGDGGEHRERLQPGCDSSQLGSG